MPAFNISPSANEVEIGPDGTARVVFTVANQIGKRVLARADLEPTGSTSAGWLSIDGKRERAFAEKAEEPVTVIVSPDPNAAPGRYTFRLRMVTTSDSASEFADASEPIAFEIKAPEPLPIPVTTPEREVPPPRKRNLWLFVAIGLMVLVLLLAVLVILLLFGGNRGNEVGCAPDRVGDRESDERLFPELSAKQTFFTVPDSEDFCVFRIVTNLPPGGGDIAITIDDRVVLWLPLTYLHRTHAGPFGIFTPAPLHAIGVSAGQTIRLDLADCRDCVDPVVVLFGARLPHPKGAPPVPTPSVTIRSQEATLAPTIAPTPTAAPEIGGIVDVGYEGFRELADVDGDGNFDFCRFVGDAPTVRLSCQLGTVEGGFVQDPYGFNSAPGIDPGYPNLHRALVDVDGEGRADFCRYVGDASTPTWSCALAGKDKMFGTDQQFPPP